MKALPGLHRVKASVLARPRDQQSVLIKNMKSHSYSQLIKALFTTMKGLKHLIDFLQSINVATRQWILNEVNQNAD